MLGVSFLIGMIRLFQSLYKKYKIDTHKMNEWIAEGINQYDGDGLISDWLDDFQKLLNILVGNLDVFESMVQ